jgi:hypothetical protein
MIHFQLVKSLWKENIVQSLKNEILMRLLLLLFVLLLLSCASEPISAYDLDYKYKSRVQVEGDDGKMRTVKLPGSKTITIFDQKTGKQFKSEGWVDPTSYNQTPGSKFKKSTNDQLYAKAQKCTRYEAVLIIDEVRSRKKASGVKVLAHFFKDPRPALFSKKRNYWWYEKKGQEYEAVELRVYAAFAMQEYLKQYPIGVTLLINHDEYLFYGVKNGFAVSKKDICRVWLKWWLDNQKDYL